MIYLDLFLTFLEIGAVSFGGGYGMISLIRELTVSKGWLTQSELLNFIAVSESTPGPIAINMATFVGSHKGGILGAFLATLGVVLPAFIIILIIVIFLKNFIKYPAVQGIMAGISPCVIGLILATAVIMFLSVGINISALGDSFKIDLIAIIILAVVIIAALIYKKATDKKISPILLILISAVLGGVLYSI